MENFISMFEIPASDFQRAVSFYKAILNIEIEEVDMEGIKMGLFPGDGSNVSGSVIAGADYKPSPDGAVIYLNGGSDLQDIMDRVVASNGKVVIPKTEISPEMGFYGTFIDTEGNRLGLYSQG
ncbi:VOC family protein [Dyadobacter sp. CY343]|uniref:VOC family protein n=1 Tax=Dyadobacter sp. CY343 TaxID=2907299 RepID=UPI001F29FA43|nr:VOC family protein [Dyadobacter sp. CY343]MCE7062141.1 VOC family protein [Dyadobacter sp. CY343]